MNNIYELVRLLFVTPRLSHREIAEAAGHSRRTVDHYAGDIRNMGLTWAVLRTKTARELNDLFNPPRKSTKVRPDCAAIDAAMSHRGVTLYSIWEDYRNRYRENALGYAQFAAEYRKHRKRRSLAMRRQHIPGQAMMVDFSGKRVSYVKKETGERIEVEMLVVVLPASNLVYVTCVPTQTVPDFIDVNRPGNPGDSLV